ncbi:hypothetical protein ABZX40_38500 [Streptomyces sp. NPDC004610]|uniref:hypothetical protein n=1 Tax=unclassified Streptomyces TaxID=2593676 RepID=UPI0033ABEEE7
MSTHHPVTPARPDGVPSGAVWEAEEGEWTLGETGAGARTGTWHAWRADGTLVEDSHWTGGVLHGVQTRYRDDGSVALVVRWRDGRRHATVVHLADGTSRESAMDRLPPSVRRMTQDFDDDGYVVRRRFHTADGSEVDLDGEPVPPRPVNVPEAAQYMSRQGHWYLQRFEPGGLRRSAGLHCLWGTDGTLKDVEYHSLDGGLLARLGSGSPLIEADRAGDAGAVERCLALGLGAAPGAALHAAYEGRAALALRLLDADGEAPAGPAYTTEPDRRGEVPGEAVWVAGLASWVIGEADRATGAALGTWRLWQSTPFPVIGRHIVTDFRDGRPAARRAYLPVRSDDLDEEWTYDAEGAVLLHRTYEWGRRDTEAEYLPDGTVVHRRFLDGCRAERVERGGALVSEVWFAEDGRTRVARVAPCDMRVEGGPVEWWRALDGVGGLIAEGPVRPGPKGPPVGEWTLYGEGEGEERGTVPAPVTMTTKVGFTGLTVRRAGDLGRFAHALHRWRTMPLPDALTGVADADWSRYRPFTGAATDFPLLLKGLAAPDELAAGHARGALRDALLHRRITPGISPVSSSVADIAGPAMRHMIALAESRPHDEDLLGLVLDIATRDGTLYATRHLNILHALAEREDDPAAFYARSGTEPAYHEIYTCLAAAVPTWTRLAREGSGRVRELARHLLAAAPGEKAATALRACMTRELARPGDRDRATLSDLLLCLSQAPGAATDALVEPFLDDHDPLLVYCASRTWAKTGATPETRAFPLQTHALPSLPGPDTPGAHPPTGPRVALCDLSPEEFGHYLTGLCALLDSAGPYVAADLTWLLLEAAFPDGGYGLGAPLTPQQHGVVTAIADTITGWTVTSGGDMRETLRYHGLPVTVDELRALRGRR